MKKISVINILEKKEQLEINKICLFLKQSRLNYEKNMKDLNVLNDYYADYSVQLSKINKLGLTLEIWNNYSSFLNILKVGITDKEKEIANLKSRINNYYNKFQTLKKRLKKWKLIRAKIDLFLSRRKKVLYQRTHNELLQRIVFSRGFSFHAK